MCGSLAGLLGIPCEGGHQALWGAQQLGECRQREDTPQWEPAKNLPKSHLRPASYSLKLYGILPLRSSPSTVHPGIVALLPRSTGPGDSVSG